MIWKRLHSCGENGACSSRTKLEYAEGSNPAIHPVPVRGAHGAEVTLVAGHLDPSSAIVFAVEEFHLPGASEQAHGSKPVVPIASDIGLMLSDGGAIFLAIEHRPVVEANAVKASAGYPSPETTLASIPAEAAIPALA